MFQETGQTPDQMKNEAWRLVKIISDAAKTQGWDPTSGITPEDFHFYRDIKVKLLFPKFKITGDQIFRLRDIKDKIIE